MRTALLLFGALALVACGGKVVVDGQGDPGAGGGATTSSSASSSTSSSATSSSSGGSCPAFPAIQGACAVPGQVCPVPFGCCGGNAVCGGKGTWEYQSLACGEACILCSPTLSCTGGAICVDYQGDSSESFSCRQDPCPGSSDCGCAQSLCSDGGLQCQSHAPLLLVCDCPNC
jgi:hypothetical protein